MKDMRAAEATAGIGVETGIPWPGDGRRMSARKPQALLPAATGLLAPERHEAGVGAAR